MVTPSLNFRVMPLAEELRKAALACKLSRKSLAEKAGIHVVTLSRFIHGHRELSVSHAESLARALGYKVKLSK